MTTESFFRALFRNTEGMVGIFDAQKKLTSYFANHDFLAAAEHAKVVSESGSDAYMNVCTRRTALDPYKRGSESDVPNVQCLWADIDYGLVGHKSSTCPPTSQDAFLLLEDLPRPSLVVNSGGGLHAYWLLDAVVETAHGKALNKALQAKIAKAAEARGWHCDAACFSPAWMLRVPGTMNHKHNQLRPVSVVSAPMTRYSASKFTTDGEVKIKSNVSVEPKPTTKSAVLARAEMKAWLKKHKKPWAKAILRGEAFGAPGERDTMINEVCATIGFKDPDTDPEALLEILRLSLVEMADAAHCDKDPYDVALEKLSRHQATARQERAEKEKQDAEIREIVARKARVITDQTTAQTEAQGGKYTAEELQSFYTKQDCSSMEFEKRWIIQRGETFYVFVDGKYMPPLSRGELEGSLPRDLAPAPVELTIETAQGGMRYKKTAELLRDYSTVARHSEANMTVSDSYYDHRTQTFVEAACRRRPLKAREDKQVHAWLLLLGGDRAELLLDWIATITELDRQTCAVYIVGKPGDGKTMFAEGLARLYTTGAPTELESVLGNFNESLLHCPIIFGDEKMPSQLGNSGTVRQIIGSNSRQLKRKFRTEADLVGAIRLILAANNDTLLNFEESLSAWDQEAVAKRFLYVMPSPKCGAYLRALGGRTGTNDWITGDRIACHALWLKETRQVVRGDRFLVEADSKALSRMLATQGKWPGLVCEWICKHIYQPSVAVKASAIQIGDGKIYANATELGNLWSIYLTNQAAPTAGLLGRTLSKLSTDKIRLGTQRYHVLDVETVLDWADRNQVGDVEAMRAAVEGAVIEHKAKIIALPRLDDR